MSGRTFGNTRSVDLIANTLVSIAVGAGLWAVLPRGVVLTRSFPATAADGRVLLDTWKVQNDSPLPIRITSVAAWGLGTVNRLNEEIEWVEFGSADEKVTRSNLAPRRRGVRDPTAGSPDPWNKVIVPPGDTLKAHVMNNLIFASGTAERDGSASSSAARSQSAEARDASSTPSSGSARATAGRRQ